MQSLGVPKPAEVDRNGELYTFEKLAAKDSGRVGFADVWYKDHFAWEYKELLDGKRIDMPPLRQVSVIFKKAPKAKAEIVARLQIPME